MPGPRRALAGCVLAAALITAGCTAAGSTPSISGPLVIYLSDPGGLSSDVVKAEQLAFAQLASQVHGFQLSLRVLRYSKISRNARAAIEDPHAIAYLGELVPGSSADSIGITNAQDLLQVSPTDTAAQFTQKVTGMRVPRDYYESFSTYGHTFARMVPTTNLEADALVKEMRSLRVDQVQVKTDGSGYGRALEQAMRNRGVVSGAATGALLFAGSSRIQAGSTLNAAVTSNPRIKLFVPSALADPAFVASLDPSAQRALYATAPRPGTPNSKFAGQAAFGYAAMQVVLDALRAAGAKANINRSTVVSDVLNHKFTDTAIGTFSIDAAGDTDLAAFAIERVKAGKLVPAKSLPG